jgi:membrane protein
MSANASDGSVETAHERTGQGKPPVLDLAKATFKEFKDDDVTEVSAAVAYHTIFAIPPMIVFLISLAALLNRVTDVPVAERLTEIINERAPADIQEILLSLVENAVAQVSGGAAITGILLSAAIALWSGSNGIGAFVKAFNRAYDVDETRGFIKAKLVNLGLTVLVSVLVIAAVALFVFGENIGQWIADQAGLGGAFEIFWRIMTWVLAPIFIMFVLALLYYLGPNIEQSFRWISPGSVVATLLWIAIVIGFSIYLSFANPGSAYGTLGSIIVLLFFLYLTAIAFVTGAEVNAVIGRRYDEKTIEDLAQNPEKLEGIEEHAAAVERAENLDRREGTSTSAGAPEPGSVPTGHHAPGRQHPARQKAPSPIWSFILAFIIARFRRSSKG